MESGGTAMLIGVPSPMAFAGLTGSRSVGFEKEYSVHILKLLNNFDHSYDVSYSSETGFLSSQESHARPRGGPKIEGKWTLGM